MTCYEKTGIVCRLEPKPEQRILVISDIHGNLSYLQGVLRKALYSPADCLIIDGDFLEKGDASLDTLHFLMELSENGNTFLISGNCDSVQEIFRPDGEETDRLLKSMVRRRKKGLLRELCIRNGIDPDTELHLSGAGEMLKTRYAEEWRFLEALPHAIETDRFIFAHAGVNPAVPLRENTIGELTHTDAFLEKDVCFPKWVIVGHWPVMLYGENIVSANPVIDRERKIISIDGGCVLKDDGQLNCLIIPEADREAFGFVSYDGFPVRKVKREQKGSDRSYYIRWGDSTVQVLEREGEFSRCRHVRTGYEMEILTKYLFSEEELTECNDCTDYVLPLEKGDEVSVVETTGKGYFVKHNGISGWYYGELE